MDFHAEILSEFERETAITRKALAAIPDGADFAWKPHEKSMSLGRLAGHLVETCGQWASGTLTQDKVEFPPEHKFAPFVPAGKEAALADFDKGVAESKAALAAFDPAQWEKNWQFGAMGKVWISDTKFHVFRNWVLNHMILTVLSWESICACWVPWCPASMGHLRTKCEKGRDVGTEGHRDYGRDVGT